MPKTYCVVRYFEYANLSPRQRRGQEPLPGLRGRHHVARYCYMLCELLSNENGEQVVLASGVDHRLYFKNGIRPKFCSSSTGEIVEWDVPFNHFGNDGTTLEFYAAADLRQETPVEE